MSYFAHSFALYIFFSTFEKMLSRHYYILCTLLWLLLLCSTSTAQSTTFSAGRWGLEVNYIAGRFLKHGTDHIPTAFSHGIELSYFHKTLGEKPWHRGMGYPEVGVAFTFFSFADHRVFGDAYALMAYAKFYVIRSRVANLYVRIGGGYGLLSRQYDAASNPTNTLISTPINMAIQLRVGLEWKINKYLQLNTAASFNHFSNAGMNLPNFGLNMPSATIGFKVFPHPIQLAYDCQSTTYFRKNEFLWKLSIGIMQLHSFNYTTPVPTATYIAPSILLAYARYINPGNKFYGGLAFEYFPAIRDYLIANDIHTRYGATFDASIPSLVLGDEFILGSMSMFYSAGIYLWKNTAAIAPIYFKIGMNVYVATLHHHRGIKFFFGNNVKAHLNVAQYNEFSIGGTL